MRRAFCLPRPRPPNSGLRGAFSTASRASSAASCVVALARPKNPPRRLAGCRQRHSANSSLHVHAHRMFLSCAQLGHCRTRGGCCTTAPLTDRRLQKRFQRDAASDGYRQLFSAGWCMLQVSKCELLLVSYCSVDALLICQKKQGVVCCRAAAYQHQNCRTFHAAARHHALQAPAAPRRPAPRPRRRRPWRPAWRARTGRRAAWPPPRPPPRGAAPHQAPPLPPPLPPPPPLLLLMAGPAAGTAVSLQQSPRLSFTCICNAVLQHQRYCSASGAPHDVTAMNTSSAHH